MFTWPISGVRLGLIKALPVDNSSFRGMWVTNCITHEITMYSWITTVLLRVDGNKTYPRVLAVWFYDRSAVQIINQSTEAKNCSDCGIEIKKKRM
nr:pectin acetylesterase 8-like [Ipomoea batatas]